MVYVPQISMAETPEMVLGLVLAVSAPIAFIMEIFGCVHAIAIAFAPWVVLVTR